jgi:hypothetical protein
MKAVESSFGEQDLKAEEEKSFLLDFRITFLAHNLL